MSLGGTIRTAKRGELPCGDGLPDPGEGTSTLAEVVLRDLAEGVATPAYLAWAQRVVDRMFAELVA